MKKMGAYTLACWLLLSTQALLSAAEPGTILDATGVKGGLVVSVGADAAKQVADVWELDSFVVQCLDADAEPVAALRKRIDAAGVHGRVTARQWSGSKLPYVDGLVNLLVIGDGQAVDRREIDRVLAPGGTLVAGGTTTVKPWPEDVDDWSHFLRSPDNNAVADDKQVGPPRTLRWDCGPMYCRSHELDVSVAAAVVEGGKLFSIIDKGPAGTIGKKMPDKWMVKARDVLFIAGAPDEVPDDDPLAPFEGRGKALLQALSPETGKRIAQYTLDAPPVFDGLIAAGGRVFVSLANGAVECW